MKRTLKIIGWALLDILIVVIAVVCIAMYVVFTPGRLTPIARQIADKYVTCEYEIGEVELTFFSTFPHFGVDLRNITLINPKEGAQSDTLASVPELVVSIRPLDALNGDIYIQRFRLKDVSANVFIATDGSTNFDVFTLPTDTVEEEKDTTGGWTLRSLVWDEDLSITTRALSFVDKKDTISASLQNAVINLSANDEESLSSVQLDLKAEHVNAQLKNETYADDLTLRLRLPARFRNTEHITIDGTTLAINEFELSLDGEAGTPSLSSGIYNMDLRLQTGKWDIPSLLALVPDRFTSSLKDVDLNGQIRLDATVQGTYSDSLMPLVQAHLSLVNGTGAYKPLPYKLRDLGLEADAALDLNKKQPSTVTIRTLEAKTEETSLSANGKVKDLLGDMLLDLHLNLDANLPDFAYFLPKTMTLTGHTKGI